MIICKDMYSLCDISKFCSAHSWCGRRTCCACVHGYCVWRLHLGRSVTEPQFNLLPKKLSLTRCWHMVVLWHSHLSLCWYPGNSLYSFVKCFQSGFINHFASHKKIMKRSLLITLDLGHMYVSCFCTCRIHRISRHTEAGSEFSSTFSRLGSFLFPNEWSVLSQSH